MQDDESSSDVQTFYDTITAFFNENNIQAIGIKKRNKRGDYAGGAISFKMEGLIQLYKKCTVSLLPAATIAAKIRKSNPAIPSTIYQYQKDAFEAAYALLR